MKETIKTINLNRSQQIRGKVMQLAGYSEDQMNNLIFEIAVDYMTNLDMGDEWLSLWLKEPLFWSWWRQQWTLVDEVFWYKYAGNLGRPSVQKALQNRYEKLHRSIDRFPDDIVYNKIHDGYEVTGRRILQKIRSKNNY